ncbi:hypothetical protein KXD93_06395 [Mucilaginibacter sp. BJC16-A38]|uniref:papain-like cysteine protease family protein n=1 Tax=Mucilaginibacter phenanthrenivorans TaxID=1234842 RepID=UPI0021572780|nr:papain-like cysteine protease family protein [Mucilaginibacter phenanthrenivorans]MCR8557261.1 hypothetical protein [Mucilaginibacter phenanthrenivorans]
MELSQTLSNSNYQLGDGLSGADLSDFPIQQQQMSQWCWAACTAAICAFYQDSPVPTQPELEATLNHKPSCAFGPLTDFCNDTCNLADALTEVGHLNQAYDDVLPVDTVVNELAAQKPVCCQMDIPGIGGHVVIIVDARQSNSQVMLQVADPANGQIIPMLYEELRDNYRGGGGTWNRSYTTN